MSEYSIQRELEKKGDNAEQITNQAMGNKSLIHDIIEAVSLSDTTTKYKSIKILRMISEKDPEALYPYFDFFLKLIKGDNNILKWNAIDIIANLATIDSKSIFDNIFDKYYGLLDEGSLITSSHIVENSAKVARAKPALRDKVAAKLLTVEKIPLPTEECRNILKGKTIVEFSKYFDLLADKEVVVKFVANQTGNTRNATKKKAEAFLKKHSAGIR